MLTKTFNIYINSQSLLDWLFLYKKYMNNLKKLIEGNTTDYFPAPVLEEVEEVQE